MHLISLLARDQLVTVGVPPEEVVLLRGRIRASCLVNTTEAEAHHHELQAGDHARHLQKNEYIAALSQIERTIEYSHFMLRWTPTGILQRCQCQFTPLHLTDTVDVVTRAELQQWADNLKRHSTNCAHKSQSIRRRGYWLHCEKCGVLGAEGTKSQDMFVRCWFNFHYYFYFFNCWSLPLQVICHTTLTLSLLFPFLKCEDLLFCLLCNCNCILGNRNGHITITFYRPKNGFVN